MRTYCAPLLASAAAAMLAASCRTAAPPALEASDPRLAATGLVLRDFDALSWDEIPRDERPLPEGLAAEVAADGRLRFRDRERFREEVLEESRRLGVREDAIRGFTPREAVIHAIDVVTSRLEFALVDSVAFRDKYPSRLFPEIDLYFHEREGDCDKYRDLVKAVFALFREMAPETLANVHVVSQGFGGKDEPHAWNAVLLSLESRIEVAHVDPTWYDGGGDLDASEDLVSAATFRVSFLFRAGEYAAAREEISRLLGKTDPWTREALLAKKAAIEIRLAESGRGDWVDVLATFELAQVDGCDHVFSRHFDRILACAVRAYAALGRDGAAKRAYERLARDYPRSVWRAALARDAGLRGILALRDRPGRGSSRSSTA